MVVVIIWQCVLSATWYNKNCLYTQEGKNTVELRLLGQIMLVFQLFLEV